MRLMISSFFVAVVLLQLCCASSTTQDPSQKREPVIKGTLKSIYLKASQNWGYIDDETGNLIIPGKYDNAQDFSDGIGVVYVRKDTQYYCINTKGEVILNDPSFVRITGFHNGRAWVAKKVPGEELERFALMNRTGETLTDFKYSWGGEFAEGLSIAFRDNDTSYIVDTTGQVIYATRDTLWGPFGNGLVRTFKNGKMGFADKKGKLVIPCKYDRAFEFVDGYAVVKANRHYGLINTQGKEILPFIYEDVSHLSSGRCLVRQGNKYGFADKDGKIAIPLQYNYAYSFVNGYAYVTQGKRNFFIDTTGKKTYEVPAQYEHCGYRLADGNLEFGDQNTQFVITKHGKLVRMP